MANQIQIYRIDAANNATLIYSSTNISGGLLGDHIVDTPGPGTWTYRMDVVGDTTFQGGIGRSSLVATSMKK